MHPLTPEKNLELTKKMGEFHAKALDELGSLYFTQESFDDFYYGKGSSFPDAQGAIGILFEQASSRGHAQESSQRYPQISIYNPKSVRDSIKFFEIHRRAAR